MYRKRLVACAILIPALIAVQVPAVHALEANSANAGYATPIPPAEDYRPGKGVPIVPLEVGIASKNWLATEPLPFLMKSDPVLEPTGLESLRPEVGTKIRIDGRTATFKPLPDEYVLENGGIDMREFSGGRQLTQAFFTVVQNPRARVLKIRNPFTQVGRPQMILAGRRVAHGELVELARGTYPMLVVLRLYHRQWESLRPGFDRVTPADLSKAKVEPTVIVEAKLLAKSKTPDRASIWIYREALAVYQYRVVKTLRGNFDGDTILASHWVVCRNVDQPITQEKIGSTLTLKLRPFEEMRVIHEVCRSETIDDFESPLFHDVGQELILPEFEPGRWNYGVELSNKMPMFFKLKNQLKLVVLGDCAAAVAHQAQLYYEDENAAVPVAYNLCQERAGLAFHKVLVEEYVAHMPKLEWVLLSWNPRYVNASWATHGMKLQSFLVSPGYQHDKVHPDEIRTPVLHKPMTLRQLRIIPDLAARWEDRPWGWHPSPYKTWTDPFRQMATAQKLKGTYEFSQERWQLFTSLLKTLVDRDVKVLAFIGPYHPETTKLDVKDKDGVTAEDYEDQIRRMRELEAKYPGQFFFYDFNRMGHHGLLKPTDFGDMDHPNRSGAEKFTRHLEQYRVQLEKQQKSTREGHQ